MTGKKGTLIVICIIAYFLSAAGASPCGWASDMRGGFSFWVDIHKVERSGEAITAITGMVGDVPVRILLNGETVIRYASGRPLDLGSVPAGTIVQVRAEWTMEGIVAKALTCNDANQVTVTGSIENASPDHFVVAGVQFTINELTDMDTVLEPGRPVLVQGHYSKDGSLVADSVESQSQLRLFGKIEQINDDGTLIVSSRMIRLTPQTVIEGTSKTQLTYDDLAVGQIVEADCEMADGHLSAKTLTASNPKTIALDGMIVTFDGTSISVKVAAATIVLSVDPKTAIHGTLAVGSAVHIEASLRSDGSLLALSITTKGAGKDKTRVVSLIGTIEELGSSSFVVSGITVAVDSKTEIKSRGRAVKFSDLEVGDKVIVLGAKQADGSILARRVEVLSKVQPPAHVEGAIQSIGASFFIVKGVKVVVDDKTEIKSMGHAVKFSDLKVGDKVVVLGTKQSNSTILARKIEVMPKG
jgi:hypothetical protein